MPGVKVYSTATSDQVKKGALQEVEVGDVLGLCSSWSRVGEGSPISGSLELLTRSCCPEGCPRESRIQGKGSRVPLTMGHPKTEEEELSEGEVPATQGRGNSWSESASPTPPGPVLTVHARKGQRLRPELLLHGDLQVELDVVHAGDDFLHGGGGGLRPGSPSGLSAALPTSPGTPPCPPSRPPPPPPRKGCRERPSPRAGPHPDSTNRERSPTAPSGPPSRWPNALLFGSVIRKNV